MTVQAPVKYPAATFQYDPYRLSDYLKDHPDEDVLAEIRWLCLHGDVAGAKSFPFVTQVTLGKPSR